VSNRFSGPSYLIGHRLSPADFFESKNRGFNYRLVFLGWGIAFFMPQFAGYLKDLTSRTETVELPFL
jgi:hypothetical protein